LKDHNFELLSTMQNYNDKQVIKFKCNYGHISTMTIMAYYCRKSRAHRYNKPLLLCDQCKPLPGKFGRQKFENYCLWLVRRNFKVISSFDDFVENKISFKCTKGHETTLTVKYLSVRKCSKAVIETPALLCIQCRPGAIFKNYDTYYDYLENK
jgi:hypothetical protein